MRCIGASPSHCTPSCSDFTASEEGINRSSHEADMSPNRSTIAQSFLLGGLFYLADRTVAGVR